MRFFKEQIHGVGAPTSIQLSRSVTKLARRQ